MRISNLKSAWQQYKQRDAMQHVEAWEILSIIEDGEKTGTLRLQIVLFNVFMFLAITMFVQGG